MKAVDAEKIEKLTSADTAAAEKINEFEAILRRVDGLDSRKMFLWLEIYNNAKDDRTCASALFTQAYTQLGTTSSEHVTLGATLVKYLERMNKANEQLLSLANIITKEIEKQTAVDAEDIFSQIEN